jgi:alpha-N-arabinofuranosidase
VVLGLLIMAVRDSPSGAKEFHNPILAGFYPDPSICRVGPDYYFLCRAREGKAEVIQLLVSGRDTSAAGSMNLMASRSIPDEFRDRTLYLRIEARENVYSFLYACGPDEWKSVRDNVDATFLSTKVAGGFVGCMYALYATSLGEPSGNKAEFEWFEYTGDDEVYR